MKLTLVKIFSALVAVSLYLVGLYLNGKLGNVIGCQEIHSDATVYCSSPYIDVGIQLVALGKISLIVAALLTVTNWFGYRSWVRLNVIALPIAIGLYVWGRVLFPPIAWFEAGVDPVKLIEFIGYWLYIPFTAITIVYSYARPKKAT